MLLGWTMSATAQGVDSTLVPRFQLAESYLRGGQYERAITLLEDLYAASPQTTVFYEKLREAYENVKRYDDAIRITDQQIRAQQLPLMLLAEKARLQYLKGDEEAAYATWNEAVALAPNNQSTYRALYRSLMQVRLFDRAISLLQQGRQTLGDASLFQSDLGYLHSLLGQHADAMQEYLGLLGQNDRQLALVRSRLSQFTEQEEALKAYVAVTANAVREDPLNRPTRELLAWLYLEGAMYREAFDANRAIDRLEGEQGNILFGFARKAADAEAYDVALDAYQEILDRYPEAPIAAEALRGLAAMHQVRAERTGERAFDAAGNRISAPHAEQAMEAYRTFLQKYPGHPRYPAVLREIGHLQQDTFFDLGSAEETLLEVVEKYPDSEAAEQAEFDLGQIALLRNDLNTARLIFGRLEDAVRTGEVADQARFELALLHFYRGDFTVAQEFVQILQENTSADMANDAIELKVLLAENRGPDSLDAPLRQYAQARLAERQRRYDQALAGLRSLLDQYATHPLADDVRYHYARLLADTGQHADALQTYRELPLLHPRSYLADRALFAAAELLETRLSDPEGAIRVYTQILTDYPGSLLLAEARTRIRLLRGDDV